MIHATTTLILAASCVPSPTREWRQGRACHESIVPSPPMNACYASQLGYRSPPPRLTWPRLPAMPPLRKRRSRGGGRRASSQRASRDPRPDHGANDRPGSIGCSRTDDGTTRAWPAAPNALNSLSNVEAEVATRSSRRSFKARGLDTSTRYGFVACQRTKRYALVTSSKRAASIR